MSVGTTATLIAGPVNDEVWRITVRNRHASAAVYLGASDVATTTGYQLDASEAVGWDLNHGDSVYGICASGTVTVHYLYGEA